MSKGIKIYLPLSGKVCLALYDREVYEEVFVLKTSLKDRFYLQANEKLVERCNMIQVKECNRCVYAEVMISQLQKRRVEIIQHWQKGRSILMLGKIELYQR